MARQTTFGDLEMAGQRRTTKRDEFLTQMDSLVPFSAWCALIAPHYYAGKGPGRPPREIETMLRMYLLQCWFGLSDEGCEDAVLDSRAMQRFMKIDLMSEQVPDASTLRRFRHLLEDNGLGKAMLDELCRLLEEAGVMMRGGSIIDATFVESPSSTKNSKRERDPEAHQGKKGKNWHFGYKMHAGADAGSGLVHTVEMTPANGSDIASAHKLVRDDDGFCYGDSGHTGIEKREEVASDPHLSSMRWVIARKPSSIKSLDAPGGDEREIERRKASVRSKVEHPFQVIKQRFGWVKTRYRGVKKNLHKARVMACLSTLAMLASAGRSLDPPPQAVPA